MPKQSKATPVILVDSREKQPIDFEGDNSFAEVRYSKLDAGDYSIEGLEKIITIERKVNGDELFTNFTKHKERFFNEFERLKDYKYKFLVIEQSCEEILNPQMYYINKSHINKYNINMPVAIVTSGLNELMFKYGVHVIYAGHKARSIIKGLLLFAYNQ